MGSLVDFSIAESVNNIIRKGNKAYHQSKYNEATEKYSSALEKEPNNAIANFNQADAIYQLGEYKQAQEYFKGIANSTNNSEIKFKSKFNLGNSLYKQEQYEESVRAYKDALKINPKDEDAKYNLMMAMAKLKKQQQNQDKNKDNKNDKQNQDKNKDQQKQQQQQNQDQKNQQDKQQQQQQGNQNQEEKEQQQKQQQQQQGQLSQEEAQRLLDALESEEGKVQQKINQQQKNGKKVKVQKDW